MTLDELLTQRDLFDRMLIAHEEERRAEPSEVIGGRNVLILVGPEGGFTDDEVERSIAAGCAPVYLGARRLRTETAAVVMAARVLLP
jgi:16S rRNA (uracil1498-N3)-methyltransferase